MIEQAVKVGEDYGADYEVVVVDDGSKDNSAEIVRGWSKKNPRVRLVQHEKNQGYGAALRTGFCWPNSNASTHCCVLVKSASARLEAAGTPFLIEPILGINVPKLGCDAVCFGVQVSGWSGRPLLLLISEFNECLAVLEELSHNFGIQ